MIARVLPWVVVVGLAGGSVWYVRHATASHAQDAALRREAEEERLRAEGLVVVERRLRSDVERQVALLEAHNRALADALDNARQRTGRARPVAAVHASTGPVASTTEHDDPPLHSVGPLPGACLLRPGDDGEIRIDQVTLETEAGSRLLVGEAQAWRLNPDRLLFEGPFEADVSEAVATSESGPRPWWHVPAAVAGGLLIGGIVGAAAR